MQLASGEDVDSWGVRGVGKRELNTQPVLSNGNWPQSSTHEPGLSRASVCLSWSPERTNGWNGTRKRFNCLLAGMGPVSLPASIAGLW